MIQKRFCLAVGSLSAFAAACSPQFSVSFEELRKPSLPVTLTSERIEMPEGIAIAVRARPMADDEIMDEDVHLALVSENDSVIEIVPLDDAGKNWDPRDPQKGEDVSPGQRVAILGVSVGLSEIVVIVDGEERQRIPANVVAQRSP